MYQNKAEEIFKCIPMKMESFYEKFATECMDFPILKYYDVFHTMSLEHVAEDTIEALVKWENASKMEGGAE